MYAWQYFFNLIHVSGQDQMVSKQDEGVWLCLKCTIAGWWIIGGLNLFDNRLYEKIYNWLYSETEKI